VSLPTVELAICRLRPWRAADADALVAAWADPEILQGSSPPNDRSLAAATRWITSAEDRYERGLAVDLAVANIDNDAVVGEVGLSSIDQRRGAALIGWWVAAEARGKGVATEAIDAFAAWALADGGLVAVVAEISPDNLASRRVAENCGFQPLGPNAWVRRR
jgi:RimJ/RimL family protein N-acetyltransferase